MLPALAVALSLCTAHATPRSGERARVIAALPDWTGLWQTDAAVALNNLPLRSAAAGKPTPPDAPFTSTDQFLTKLVPLAGDPPYNATWQKKYREGRKNARSAPITTSASASCRQGFPGVVDLPTSEGMFQVVVAPEATVFVFGNGETRLIYTDGRSHPKKEDLWPTRMGDSIGHWESGTLVIDTIARAAGPVSSGGPIGEHPPHFATLSAQAHFSERIRRIDANTMRDDLTIDDPERFVHPWKMSIGYQRVTDADRMIFYDCEGGQDRNPIVNGRLTIAPP